MTHASNTIGFGQFALDMRSHVLYKGRKRIKLQRQPVQVLEMLVLRAGETVLSEDIIAKRWSRVEVDGKANLHTAISKIRVALNDSLTNPRYIETVTTVGYRFIGSINQEPDPDRAQVEPVAIDPSEPPADPEPGPPDPEPGPADPEPRPADSEPPADPDPAATNFYTSPGDPHPDLPSAMVERFHALPIRTRFFAAKTAIAVALVLLLGSLVWEMPRTPQSSLRHRIVQSDFVQLPLTTDGQRVYFGTWDNGRFGLSQVLVDGGNTEEIASPGNPDLCDLHGNSLLIRVVPLSGFRDGLAPLAVLPLLRSIPRQVGNIDAYDASWGSGGETIVYSAGAEIYTVLPDGTEKRRIATVPLREGKLTPFLWWLRWSPDRQRLRFNVTYPGVKGTRIWEASKDGKRLEPLSDLTQFPSAQCGSWSPDGRYFVFEGVREGSQQLWAIPSGSSTARQEIQPVSNSDNCRGPAFSPDGRKIFVRRAQYNWEVVKYSSAARNWVPVLRSVSADMLTFSRDGKWLAYTSAPEGGLWIAQTSAATERRQITEGLEVGMPRWSPDASRIAFMGRKYGAGWRIYVWERSSGQTKEMLPNDDSQQADPDWSSDGKRLLFGQNPAQSAETSRPRILSIYTFESGSTEPLKGSENLHSPRWSPDGRFIMAVQARTQKLRLYDTETSQWSELTGPNPIGTGYPSWSHDGQRVYFLTTERNPDGSTENVVMYVRLAPRELVRVTGLSQIRQSPLTFGTWIGLDSEDAPLAVNDLTHPTIEFFDWDRK